MGINEEKVALLRNLDIFSQLLEYALDIIARYSEMVHFKKKEVIFSHGTPANELYVLTPQLVTCPPPNLSIRFRVIRYSLFSSPE